jgi:formate-dependent phosphoribosylglycinamide formyltransferase (GAR transformylase)
MAKIALLVGSSFSACPLLFSLKRRGLEVWVCGNLGHDPCHSYADRSFYIDYSKVGELAPILDAHDIDYLVPSCNDAGYLSCAELAKSRGFVGYDSFETTLVLHDKAKFRQFAASIGLKVPRFVDAASASPSDLANLRFPVLVKPVDSFSGRGVTKLSNAAELDPALSRAKEESRSGAAVVEEFIEGSLHSHSALIQDGKISLDFFVDEFCTVYPYQVDCSNHPSALGEAIRSDVRRQMQQLITSLALCDGLIHTQFIVSGHEAFIIECMRRAPGDLYNVLIERSTGFAYADSYVCGFLGERPAPHDAARHLRNISRHTVSRPQATNFESLKIDAQLGGCEFFPLQTSGQRVGAAPFDKFGIAFMEHASEQELFAAAPSLAARFTPLAYGG